jgi:8-oxo-dGTP pyrophosphatase MutT (NUDIX family)
MKPTDWKRIYSGKLFEVLQNGKGWERVARAPGVRVIIDDVAAGRILLSHEFRYELNEHDFRLPGGKVFDTLDDLDAFRASGADILTIAQQKAIDETREEVGMAITEPEFYDKSTLGATVEWDLFVFIAREFSELDNDARGEDEKNDITGTEWFSYDEIKQMIMDKKMQEDRVAMILLRYLNEKGVKI